MTRMRTTDAARVGVCPELPPELWNEVMRQTGNSIDGFVTRLQLARVQKHEAGPKLPCRDGVCAIGLREVAMYPRCKNRECHAVYMIDTGKVTNVCCHSEFRAVRMFEQYKHLANLPKSAMWHAASSIVYWVPPQNKTLVRVGLRVGFTEAELADVDLYRVEQLGRKPLVKFGLSASSLQEASAPATQRLVARHESSSSDPAQVLASIVKALSAPANRDIYHLDLNLNHFDGPLDGLTASMASRLTHLTLRSFSVNVASLLCNADNLVMLALHDAEIDADAVCELMQLYVRWGLSGRTGTCGVHMDQVRCNNVSVYLPWYCAIVKVVVAAGVLLTSPDAQTVGVFEETENGLVARSGTPTLWFTCARPHGNPSVRFNSLVSDIPKCEADIVAEFLCSHLPDATPVEADGGRTFELAQCSSFVARLIDSFRIAPLVPPPLPLLPPSVPPPVLPPPPPPPPTSLSDGQPDPSRYSDAGREQVRHMWQWFASTCNSCGTVWQPNCVTISWRQSAVSSCLHNKRKCQARPEFARMMNGEKFLTGSHWLTPSPEKVLEAEKDNFIVAIDPRSQPDSIKYKFFRPEGMFKRPVENVP